MARKRELLQSEEPGFIRWGEPGWAPVQEPTFLTLLLGAEKEHPWKADRDASTRRMQQLEMF